MPKPKAFPKSMAACADLLYDKRTERLAADKVAAALKADEQALIEHIINNLPKDSGGAIGKHHVVEVYTEDILQVKDWPAFYAYVAKNKAFDMLQRRLTESAVQARLDDKKKVPGIGTFTTVKVSLKKRVRV